MAEPGGGDVHKCLPLTGGWSLAPALADGTRPAVAAFSPAQVPGTFEEQLGNAFDGVGWYRMELGLNPAWRGARVRLAFAGAATEATVFINGQEVARHLGAWTPFTADLSEHLTWSGEDLVEVRLDEKVGHNTQGFLPTLAPHFGGLWQAVRLCVSRGPVLDEHALAIVGDGDTGAPGGAGHMRVNAPRLGAGDSPLATRVRAYVGKELVAVVQVPGTEATLPIPTPRLWSPADPFLYRLLVELVDPASGRALDSLERVVGLRTFAADGETILLNGAPLSVRGLLDWGYRPPRFAPDLGKEDWLAQFATLKSWGFNLIKVCLWVPPDSFYAAADEAGLLVWQEYPTWHPQMDAEHLQELRAEFAEFFRLDGGHVSVVLRSLTCESGRNHADPAVLGELFRTCHERIPQTLVIDDSSWIGWSHHHDFYDDHPYSHNSRWRARLAEFRKHINSSEEERPVQPLLFGEAITGDTWWQRPAVAAAGLLEETAAWRAPAARASMDEFAAWARSRFGPECVADLRPDSLDYVHRLRKYQIERLALDMPRAGFVSSVWRDIPKAPMGYVDYAGEAKWQQEDFSWLADTMLLLDDDEDRRAFRPGDATRVRVRHFGSGDLRADLVISLDGVPLLTQADIELAPGQSSASFPVVIPRTPVTRPRPALLEAHLMGSHASANSWRLWLLPRPASRTGQARKIGALDAATMAFLEAGGAALLAVGEDGAGFPMHRPRFDAGGPFVPPHPIHADVPPQLLKDLLAFDLENIPVLRLEELREQVDPIVARWDTHDADRVHHYAHAFTTRVGQGRLLVTSLNLDSDAGRWLQAAFLAFLENGPAPSSELTWRPE